MKSKIICKETPWFDYIFWKWNEQCFEFRRKTTLKQNWKVRWAYLSDNKYQLVCKKTCKSSKKQHRKINGAHELEQITWLKIFPRKQVMWILSHKLELKSCIIPFGCKTYRFTVLLHQTPIETHTHAHASCCGVIVSLLISHCMCRTCDFGHFLYKGFKESKSGNMYV